MAQVQISDVIVPELFTSYQIENSFISTAFFQSGVAVRNGVIDDQLHAGSEQFTVPVWSDLPDVEANYSTDNPADVAVPNKISAYAQIVRKAFMNNAWAQADLAAELSGSNPLQRIQSRVQAFWDRQLEMRLIASLQGIIASNIANNGGDMVIDMTGEQPGLSGFNAEAVIEAAGTLGDRLNSVKAIAMHSSIYQEALKNDLIEFIPQSQGDPLRTFRGLAVVIDDGLVYSAPQGGPIKYVSVLFGQSAVGYGFAAPRTGVATELWRIPSAGNGGGITQLWSRFNAAIAPVGWSWTNGGNILGDSPAFADLANPANWSRVSISRKACPIAFLLTL